MADEQKVLELIERAGREAWTELNLSVHHLTRLPPKITKLTNLTSLGLSNNELTSLPTIWVLSFGFPATQRYSTRAG